MPLSEEEIKKNSEEKEAEEEGIKTYIPIINTQKQKIICLGIMGFVLTFAYSSSRELKDSYFLEVMPSSSVPYIKLLFVLPINIIVNIGISLLLNKYTVQKIFIILTIFFIIYFIIMGLILIPLRTYLQISIFSTIDLVSDNKIRFFGVIINILIPIYFLIGNWVVSLNYCMIEIFSSTLYSFLMYAFFNTVCEIEEFKKFISIIFISCNIGTVISGFSLMILNNWSKKLNYNNSQKLFYGYFIIVAIFCFISLCLQYIINKSIKPIKINNKKSKQNIFKSLKILLSSKVILSFSFTVIFYNFLVNIIEIEYKANTQRYQSIYLNGSESMQQVSLYFQSTALLVTGIIATIIMLSSLKNSIKMFGWTLVALITPIFLLLSGSIVFILSIINFTKSSSFNTDFLSVKFGNLFNISHENPQKSVIFMKKCLWVSCIFVALSKAFKYAFFDVTKEAFSMEIDKKERAKYKSIYDGVCGKLGKSIASIYLVICKGLFTADNSNEFTPISTFFSFFIVSIWIISVIYVGKAYNKSQESGKPMDIS